MISIPQLGLFSLVFVAGLGIPMMAAMSGQLSMHLGLAKGLFVIFTIAFAVSGLYLMYVQGLKTDTIDSEFSLWSVPPVLYMAGLIVVFYMLAVSIVGPKIGIANTIMLVLLGQIISAIIIDHFGLFKYPIVSINPTKLIGVVFMVIGIYLARR